jgi:hypothetical protein
MMSLSAEPAVMPLIAGHAQMWHHRHGLSAFRGTSALLNAALDALPRDRGAIVRSATWPGLASADDFVAVGTTTFMVEVHPTACGGHPDVLEDMTVRRRGLTSSSIERTHVVPQDM